MADTTGPISTLPGARHTLPAGGCMCDDHPDVPAVARIQGETDSMGCELHDMCQVCVDAHNVHANTPVSGMCEWCKSHSDNLRRYRDWEEGSCGPLYDVCRACIKKQNDALAEEAAESDYDDYPFGD